MTHYFETKVILKNNKECLIRSLHKEDAREYLETFTQIIGETEYDTYYTDEITRDVNKFSDFLEEKDMNIYCINLGAFVDGKLVGHVSIEPYGYCSKLKHRCTLSLMVLKEYSNLGIGYHLPIEAVRLAKEFGYQIIMLDVVKDNLPAVHLYQKLGFKEYGIFEKYFRKRDGTYQDNILMRMDF